MPDPLANEWCAADGIHIDVRGLPPPEPMVAILALLENPDTEDRVIVHHDREPVYLYPELVERGWNYEIITGGFDEVRLLLTRQA